MVKKKKKKESVPGYLVIIPLAGLVFLLVYLNISLFNQRKLTQEQLSRVKEDYQEAVERRGYSEAETNGDDLEEEVERIAREQLLLQKEGESVIVISREEELAEEEEEEKEEEKSLLEMIVDIFTTE